MPNFWLHNLRKWEIFSLKSAATGSHLHSREGKCRPYVKRPKAFFLFSMDAWRSSTIVGLFLLSSYQLSPCFREFNQPGSSLLLCRWKGLVIIAWPMAWDVHLQPHFYVHNFGPCLMGAGKPWERSVTAARECPLLVPARVTQMLLVFPSPNHPPHFGGWRLGRLGFAGVPRTV